MLSALYTICLLLLTTLSTLMFPAFTHAAASGITVPTAPHGRVNDYPGVLDVPHRHALERLLDQWAQSDRRSEHTDQLAVVVVSSLYGEPGENVSLRFAEHWKIGTPTDEGVLLFVAVAEKEVFIDVGHGSEGRLPSALSAHIIHDFMAPRLHNGDFAGGLHTGIVAIHQALVKQPVTGLD